MFKSFIDSYVSERKKHNINNTELYETKLNSSTDNSFNIDLLANQTNVLNW